jgi:hypothetical protein
MKVDGHCHCGAVSFEAEVDPEKVTLCHCTDCQMLTGSAFRVVARSRPDAFRLTKGKPATYLKTADSGARREHGFCGGCGTPVYAVSIDPGPKVYSIRIGTIRQRAELRPVRQIWTRSALPWVGALDAVPAAEGVS